MRCSFLAAGSTSAQPILPDPAVTPGALNPNVTQATIGATICAPGWTRTVRPPYETTNQIKHELLRKLHAAGYSQVGLHDVELDHVVSIGLGGAPDDIRNLWLEPRGGEWSAARKDDLEAVLPRLVCAGRVSLAEAQQAIGADWVQASWRYVGREGPARWQ